jgi:hypothetical protein
MTATRATSPFGFSSTAADVSAGIDLHGRRALITGAASGIGVETARALASAGAQTHSSPPATWRPPSASPPTSAAAPETRRSRWRSSTCSTGPRSTAWSTGTPVRCTS